MQCWGKMGTGALLPRAKDIRAYRESKATPTATSHAECFTSFPSFSISLHTQEFAHLQLCHLLSGRSRGRSFHLGFHLIGCIWGRPGPIPQTPVPPKSTAPSLRSRDVHGKGPAAPWRPRARLQLQAGIPATTVQEEDLSAVSSFPHTVPCLEKKKEEAHRGSLARAAGASRALCRLAVDARQANPGGAAAMEKSHHPTARWGCFRRRLLQTEANRAV